MNEITKLILFSLFVFLILALAEILFKKLKLENELTRKFAHITVGLSTIFMVEIVKNKWLITVVMLFFLLIMILSKKFNLLNSLNDANRKTYGTYWFPISIYVSYLVYDYYQNISLFIIPILILSISDALAAMVGTNIKSKKIKIFSNNQKTIAGSLTFFLSTLIIAICFLPFYYNIEIAELLFYAFSLSIIVTVVELISFKGLDNITIPVTTIITLLIFQL